MTERDFVYWLNGYLEISGSKEFSAEQVQIINDHLKLVLSKVTPNRNNGTITIDNGITTVPYLNGITCSAVGEIPNNPFPKMLKG